MSGQIVIQPITAKSFAPYGDLIDCSGEADMIINLGKCGRFHDRAQMDFGTGRAGLSLFRAEIRALPYTFSILERHPLGSQAFVPMCENGFLVIVADDANGTPINPKAFVTQTGQAINLHKGTWHGVLTPLAGSGQFAVIDRIGEGNNLEEFTLETPHTVVRAST